MKVYILEDEINILKHIISLVEAIPYLQIVGYSAEISKAQIEIPNMKPDLILSDIQLTDGSSFTLFQNIDISDTPVIFITAYNQYAIEALNIGAFAYLLKPIETEVFNETLDRCFQKKEQFRFERNQMELARNHYTEKETIKRIALKSVDYTQIIQIADIVYCQSDKGYTTFFLKDGNKIVVSKVLKEYETLLPATVFIRCHQSFLVNVNYISKYYKDGNLQLTTKDLIPVSERKKEIVIDYLNQIS
ncbi:two-component system, LytT family, response regulator [Paenimyroides ummariense]|uniref:Two-component system, LytT family, response regulator n=1 Tax=Paenimyroides ummariense TaxID=913024 RepID=A0A1I4W2F2_9FLAO|nr:LytTR family DNA-binding domain-containing protein [Paenimyroides ummariense]SFN07580.1 two-component system, LytT family, response regulator [Paenimyroides ummariense]